MKISKSKQELARIISENGGWRDGAEFAWFQGKLKGGPCHEVWFGEAESEPEYVVASGSFHCYWDMVVDKFSAKKFDNWHQTILSREEYFHLYPAPDADGCIKRDENGIISIEYNKDNQEVVAPGELNADGWIEWKGGKCPVDKDARIDIRMTGGKTYYDTDTHWGWNADSFKITHYRLHKPEQSMASKDIKVTPYGDSTITIGGDPMTAMRRMQDSLVFDTKPTIEQMAADYHNAKGFAERKQREADDAKADADEKLRVLELAGEALGLLVSPITEKQEPELVIADWRDLQVGDEVEAVVPNGGSVKDGELGVIVLTCEDKMWVNFPSQRSYIYYKCHFERGDVKFIRRP